jgi:flagellar assembly protein FliH
VAARRKSLPDKIFKSDDIQDEGTGITIKDLGPEEEFAKNILKSLKDKISDARNELEELEQEIKSKENEAEERREEILEEARNEAEEIRQEAESEAQEIIENKENEVESAREEGYDDGYDDGRQDAREDMADLLDQAEEVLLEAKHQREAYLNENLKTLVELAGLMAERIVRDRVDVEDTTIKRVLQSALSEVSDAEDVTVVLSPDDAEVIRDVKSEYVEDHPNLEQMSISEDSKMKRGGCRIETRFGNIQGTVKGQIEHLSETLIESNRENRNAEEE